MAHFHHVTPILRKDRDSNPGTPKGVNGFRDRPVRPLRHLSNGRFAFLIKCSRSQGTEQARALTRLIAFLRVQS